MNMIIKKKKLKIGMSEKLNLFDLYSLISELANTGGKILVDILTGSIQMLTLPFCSPQ